MNCALYDAPIFIPKQIIKPHTKYISGPNTLTKHEDDTGRIIYVFGEAHGLEESCPGISPDTLNIEEFFNQLFATTCVPIDFYLEAPLYHIGYGHIQMYEYTSHLHVLREQQVNVYRLNPMVRNHYVDPRGINSEASPLNIFDDILRILDEENEDKDNVLQILDLWYSQDLTNIEAFINYMEYTLYDTTNYVGKEISRSILGESIIAFIVNIFKQTYNMYWSKLDNLIHNIRFQFNAHNIQWLKIYATIFNAPFLDAYLLARLFKVFEHIPYGKSPLFSTHSQNCIIYVGNEHATYIRDFLVLQGFKTLESAQMLKDDDIYYMRCLDISHIKQPLFI